MEEYKLKKVKSCLFTIQDNLNALFSETSGNNPYPEYCLEKLSPILNDTKVLIHMFEEKKNANNK